MWDSGGDYRSGASGLRFSGFVQAEGHPKKQWRRPSRSAVIIKALILYRFVLFSEPAPLEGRNATLA